VNLDKSSLIDQEEKEKPHSDEDSRTTMNCMNEDDEKLQTSVIEKECWRFILIIRGVDIFMPSG
jgi:hypothetical protein